MIASEVCDVVLLYFVDFMDMYMGVQASCAHACTYIIYQIGLLVVNYKQYSILET